MYLSKIKAKAINECETLALQKALPHHLEFLPFWRRHCPPLYLALCLAPAGQLPEQAQLLLAFYGYADGVEGRTRYKHVKGNKKKSDGGKKTTGSG